MSNRINIDDVFRDGLGGHELPFDESSWANMQHKMADDAVKPKFWLPFLSKKIIKIFIAMTFLTTLISSMFWLNASGNARAVSASHTQTFTATVNQVATVKIGAGKELSNNTTAVNTTSSATTTTVPVKTNANNAPVTVTKDIVVKSKSTTTGQTVTATTPSKVSAKSLLGIRKASRELIKKPELSTSLAISNPLGLKPQFRLINDDDDDANALNSLFGGGGHYDCATIGFHFHYVSPMKNYSKTGQMPGMGFDVEVYTPNILPSQSIGFFAGLSGSIAWMGKSSSTPIKLNTANNDPGKTFLQSNMGDLNLMGKVEIGPGDLKLYGTIFGGWRFHTVSQSVESDKTISGFENSSNQVWSNSSLQWGLGGGLRYHFAPGVSLDIRGMYHDVDMMKLADVKESTFNASNAKFDLAYNVVDPKAFSLKIGFLFCLHSDDCSNTNMNTYPNTTPGRRKNPVRINAGPKVTTPHTIKVAPKVNN